MESDMVYLPEPLGCFVLPSLQPTGQVFAVDESPDECILSEPRVMESLRATDPSGCFLCVADSLGDED